MATDTAKGLLQDIATAGRAYEAGDLNARRKHLHLFQELTVELEPPGETFLRVNWAEVRHPFNHGFGRSILTIEQPTRAYAIRVAIDLDIFKTLSEDGDSPKSSVQLAAVKNADPMLVGTTIPDLRRKQSDLLIGCTLCSESDASLGSSIRCA